MRVVALLSRTFTLLAWPVALGVAIGSAGTATALVENNEAGKSVASSGKDEALPAPAKPAEKLPIGLPELKVIGHEVKPDVNAGAKLPLEASASVAALPAPPAARATTELLDKLRLPVPLPPDGELGTVAASDRMPFTSMWGGLGSIPLGGLQGGSYDFGLYHGRQVGPVLSITDLAMNSHGLDHWSSVKLDQQVAWSENGSAAFGYRREQQAPDAASALQEGAKLQASWAQGALSAHLDAAGGRIESSGSSASGTTAVYGVGATFDFEPDLWFDDHLVKFGLQLGHLGASGPGGAGWSSPLLAVKAADRFHPFAQFSVDADMGLTLWGPSNYADPGLRVGYRPGSPGAIPPGVPGDNASVAPLEGSSLAPSSSDEVESPTEVWLGLANSTRLPDFEGLYLSRQRTVGNADLRPQRTEPRVEVGAGHRFTDRLYASTSLGGARVLDWIHYGPAGGGLWQPRNFGGWQNVLDLEFDSQYLWSEASLQRFAVKVTNPTGLGERRFTAGTSHEGSLLDGLLAVSAGTSVDYVELGPNQGGGQGIDWRTDWEVGYRITAGWQLFVAGKDWHVWQQEPAAGYFATPAQVSAGFKLDF